MHILLDMIYNVIYFITSTVVMTGVSILDAIIYGINENIAIALVTVQAGLMLVAFSFLPMILENSKEYYLGYKISNWILYKRSSDKLNNLVTNWIFNIVTLIVEIICIPNRWFTLAFLLFIAFIIVTSKKVIKYINFIANPNSYDSEIEQYFLNNVKEKRNELIDSIEKNCYDDIKSFKKTINFLLNNLDNEDVKQIFDEIYYFVINSSNQDNTYKLYELISTKIETLEKGKKLNFVVSDYEWYTFIRSNITEVNENKLFHMFRNIYENNLELYDVNKHNYTPFLKTTQLAIDDSTLTVQTKRKWLNNISELIHIKIRTRGTNFNNKELFRYRNQIEFIKYIIDSKEKDKLNKLYQLMESMETVKTDLLPIFIGIYVYLIYLTEFEVNGYISDEEREYYKSVLKELVEYMNLKDVRIYDNISTNNIFDIFYALSFSYMNWERMKTFVVKNVTTETAYNILYKIFVIYSKMKFLEVDSKITEKELEIFRFCIPNGNFEKQLEEKILNISEKLNIPITKDILDQYAKNITKYVTNKYKNETLISNEAYKKQLDLLKTVVESSNTILSKAEIFNNSDFKVKGRLKSEFNNITANNYIEVYLQGYLENPSELQLEIEDRIYKMIAKKIDKKKKYNVKGEELLNTLEEYSDKDYIYLTHEDDEYGKNYMIGEKYNDVLKNYKLIHTLIPYSRIVLNKIELKFNKVDIQLLKLTDSEIEEEIKKYKVDENKYMYNNINYGYDIEFNKEEIKEFVKNNFTKIVVTYFVDFGDFSNIDGCVLEYNFNN